MDIQNMKNMIVLKNLPSNMIEEAFVVLKSNVKLHKTEAIDKINGNGKAEKNVSNKIKNNEYVIKEAKLIVSEYINRINKREVNNICNNKKLTEQCKRLKIISTFFALFSVLTSICILCR